MSSQQAVPHAGGKITITPGPNNTYQLGIRGSSPHQFRLYQLAVSYEGKPLAFVPAGGIGTPMPPFPTPSVLTYIISDEQGMWGRTCPQCRSYFRTTYIAGITICPYCTFAEDGLFFMPDSHLRYVKKFAQTVIQVLRENRELEIDLDEATDRAEWTYDERQLQHRFTCVTCRVDVDILGEYGSCPSCGKRNSGSVFHRKLNEMENELKGADESKRSELLNRAVSLFEAMANDLKRVLVSIPCHPRRMGQVAHHLNFQDIALAVEQLDTWYGFDLRAGIRAGDLPFLDRMFKRRHLFTHTGGRVDEKYLRETGDQTFQLNELVVLMQDEMEGFITLLRRLATNLISDVEAIEQRYET